jgi:UDP-GlcNAc:undecaprenyl-phosphate GlcNAc-1-phosphate transferase
VPAESRVFLGLMLASIAVYCATPLAIRIASRLEFYDQPIGYKGHAVPTPYLGGAAVMLGFLLALAALTEDARRSIPLAGGAAILWAVGTVDDRRNVAPWARAAIEVGVAGCLWALGLGWDLGWGAGLDLALTCLWIVAVVNAFNLFDNMDGAAATMALVVATALAGLGVLQGDPWLAATGAALAGACLGFLPHNLASPARIFLGDGGSMPVGFVVAAMTMIGASDAVPEWQALIVGLLLVGIPAVDTCLVVISRRRKGLSILTGGRDHLTHRSRRRLRDARRVALVLGSAQAVISALALVAVEGGSLAILGSVLMYLIAAGAAIALFEAQEDQLLVTRPGSIGEGPTAPTSETPPSAPRGGAAAYAALAVLGLGAALSPFWRGFYDATTWVPLGVGVIIAVAAGAVSRPPLLSRASGAAVACVAGLALWTLLSATWAESVDQAVIEGNRLLVLVAVLGVALILVRDERRAAWLVGVLGAGILVVALWTVGTMLGPTPASVFLSGRLHEPLGYINAEATVFIMGFWISMALSERRNPALAGLGLAAATLMAALVVLSESRGAALAAAASGIAVLAVVPGRRRRAFALLLVAGGVLVASDSLQEVYRTGLGGQPPVDVVRHAARATLAAAGGAGIVWAAVSAIAARGIAVNPRLTRRAATVVLSVLALGAVGVAAAASSRIADTIDRQYTAFVHLSEPGSEAQLPSAGSRLVSGGGNRFDYWRVAWEVWQTRPLLGVGAGNYDASYFRSRTTSEDVRQPHSIELQALSETGLIGAILLVLAFVAIAVGGLRAGRAARTETMTRTVVVAGVGGGAAWMAHASVDWMHLLPGVTAIALCLIAVLLRRRTPLEAPQSSAPPHLRPAAVALAAVVAAALVLAGASLTRQGLADHYRAKAADALPGDPANALVQADRSLRLNGDAVRTYYVKAAAQARFDRGAEAERTLQAAAAKEPSDFVTWALLGDLALRRGHEPEAKAYYVKAARLNPRDPALAQRAADPTPARP